MVGQILEHRIVKGEPERVASAVTTFDWLRVVGFHATEASTTVNVELRGRLGAGSAAKVARMEVGAAQRNATGYTVPVTWEAVGGDALFPVMDAILEILPAGTGMSAVTFWGRYDPPLGRLGDLVDRSIAHRVARSTVDGLLDALAERCELASRKATVA